MEQQQNEKQNEFISSVPVFSSPVANSSPTISYKKLVNNLDLLSESGNTGVETDDKCMKGSESIKDYQIMDMNILSNAITCLACPDRFSVSIKLFESLNKYGLAIQYYLQCTKDNCSWEKSCWSSGKPKDCRSFDINSRIIYAMRRIGLGLVGMKTFLM